MQWCLSHPAPESHNALDRGTLLTSAGNYQTTGVQKACYGRILPALCGAVVAPARSLFFCLESCLVQTPVQSCQALDNCGSPELLICPVDSQSRAKSCGRRKICESWRLQPCRVLACIWWAEISNKSLILGVRCVKVHYRIVCDWGLVLR